MSAGMAGVIAVHNSYTTHWEGRDGESAPAEDHAARVAEELTKAGQGNVQAKGYIIVDKVTGALDWDGELHSTVEAALSSLCGPHQSFCRDPEGVTGDETTYWADVYAIHPVSARLDPNFIDAVADPEGHGLVKAIHDRKAEA